MSIYIEHRDLPILSHALTLLPSPHYHTGLRQQVSIYTEHCVVRDVSSHRLAYTFR